MSRIESDYLMGIMKLIVTCMELILSSAKDKVILKATLHVWVYNKLRPGSPDPVQVLSATQQLQGRDLRSNGELKWNTAIGEGRAPTPRKAIFLYRSKVGGLLRMHRRLQMEQQEWREGSLPLCFCRGKPPRWGCWSPPFSPPPRSSAF